MSLLQEMLNTVSDAKLLHVAVVHIPIGLALFGPLAAGALVALPRHRLTLRWVVLVVYAGVAATALVAARAGEATIPRYGMLAGEARSTISAHAALGGWVWIVAGSVVAAAALAFHPREGIATWARWCSLMLATGCAALVGIVGHLGGTFVHVRMPEVAAAEAARLRAKVQIPDSPVVDPAPRFFLERVQPVFAASCVWCHSTEDGEPAGGLDLTSRVGLLKGGQGGPVVVLGKPEESVLYQSIARTHPVLKMPKRASKLPDDQIEAIAQWIRDGCVWGQEPDAPSDGD